MTNTTKYYFYNGFAEPRVIDMKETEFTRGQVLYANTDVTDEVLEEHNFYDKESDEEYNEQMSYYGVYRNPKLSSFVEANTRWFDSNSKDLSANLNIDSHEVMSSFEMSDYIERKYPDEEFFDVIDFTDFVKSLGYEFVEHLDMWVKDRLF